MVGPEGVEPSRREAQEPKSCVSANFTTGPKIRGSIPQSIFTGKPYIKSPLSDKLHNITV